MQIYSRIHSGLPTSLLCLLSEEKIASLEFFHTNPSKLADFPVLLVTYLLVNTYLLILIYKLEIS